MLEQKTIIDYLKEYSVVWAVRMPKGCPPNDIEIPHQHPFFRYAKHKAKYDSSDFKSYAELNPQKEWGNMLPLAVGLSVINNLKKAKRNLKLPMLRRYNGIICLKLNPIDGVVKQTGAHHSHYTWWRTTHFEMLNLQMYGQ
ncbi:MAG: hypothetical protein ACI30R_00915 [Sodaliphilus sp.]